MFKQTFKTITTLVALIALLAPLAHAQRPARKPAPVVKNSPWLVTVVHEINFKALVTSLQQSGMQVVNAPVDVRPINYTTGIVIDREGHILTRLININPDAGDEGIGAIKVTLSNGETRPASFIGLDGPSGYCLVKVEGLNVEPATLTDYSSLGQGMQVTVLDVRFKQNGGIGVSQFRVPVRELLQMLGKVNPLRNRAFFNIKLDRGGVQRGFGNLGNAGVVVNKNNEVVGLPDSMRDNSLQAFSAIEARRAADRILEKKGNVARAWLGVNGHDVAKLTPDQQHLLSAAKGVYVESVAPNSPAANYGLRDGDVITAVEGEEIESLAQLTSFIALQPADRKVVFDVLRNNKKEKVDVILGARGFASPYGDDIVEAITHNYFIEKQIKSIDSSLDNFKKLYNNMKDGENDRVVLENQIKRLQQRKNELERQQRIHTNRIDFYRNNQFSNKKLDREWMGVIVIDIPLPPPPAVANYTPKPGERGVRVVEVVPGSLAAQAGIKVDDIISQIGSYAVQSQLNLNNVLHILQRSGLDSVDIIITRNGEFTKVKMNLPKNR